MNLKDNMRIIITFANPFQGCPKMGMFTNMNLNSFEHNDNSNEIIAMNVSELTEIIAKKIWISYHNHWNIPDKKHFFIIYNINNQTIEIIKQSLSYIIE